MSSDAIIARIHPFFERIRLFFQPLSVETRLSLKAMEIAILDFLVLTFESFETHYE